MKKKIVRVAGVAAVTTLFLTGCSIQLGGSSESESAGGSTRSTLSAPSDNPDVLVGDSDEINELDDRLAENQIFGDGSDLPVVNVEYIIDGVADSVFIDYVDETGEAVTVEAAPPWRYEMDVQSVYVYLSARAYGESSNLTCRVLVDGVEYKSSTLDGYGAYVQCSGFID